MPKAHLKRKAAAPPDGHRRSQMVTDGHRRSHKAMYGYVRLRTQTDTSCGRTGSMPANARARVGYSWRQTVTDGNRRLMTVTGGYTCRLGAPEACEPVGEHEPDGPDHKEATELGEVVNALGVEREQAPVTCKGAVRLHHGTNSMVGRGE